MIEFGGSIINTEEILYTKCRQDQEYSNETSSYHKIYRFTIVFKGGQNLNWLFDSEHELDAAYKKFTQLLAISRTQGAFKDKVLAALKGVPFDDVGFAYPD